MTARALQPMWFVAVSLALVFVAAKVSYGDSRPNIVVVMVDDMGYSDFGCYGGEIDTPHIDTLASRGLRFTQFYNCGRCCPTRASLLTGLYPHRTGLGFMTARDYGYPGYRAELNRKCVTIAEALNEAGYATYMSGKWHVCKDFAPDGPKHNWPLQRGFDRFFGTLIAAGSQWNPLTLVEGNRFIKPTGDFFYTEAITDKAIEFLNQHDEQRPFFLYVAHTAPHWPLQARAEMIEKYLPLHESLCWEHHGNRAVRMGNWKLVGVEGGDWELFDLKNDRTETRNLAARKPEIVRRLLDVYADWSRHCGVLSVSELQIEEIPDDKNPLTREPDEMREFIETVNQSLRKHRLPEFASPTTSNK